MNLRKLLPALAASLTAAVMTMTATLSQAEIEVTTRSDGERTVARQVSATVAEVDLEGRDITLEGPFGQRITLHVSEDVSRLDEFEVGDVVTASYAASLSGELRDPTPEEIQVPWVEIDAGGVAGADQLPAAAAGMAVKAVCTIEGMNRLTGTVTILDSRGVPHVIGDVDPERMTEVNIGQTIILTYTSAVALSLEKAGS